LEQSRLLSETTVAAYKMDEPARWPDIQRIIFPGQVYSPSRICTDRRGYCEGRCRIAARARALMNAIKLPSNGVEEDEVNVLAKTSSTAAKTSVQTVPYTAIPPEIRNHIHELALPPSGSEFIICIPFKDQAMSLGIEPPLAKTCRLLRPEILSMFYAGKKFTAYTNTSTSAILCRVAATTAPSRA
jgi:hypothetical protein